MENFTNDEYMVYDIDTHRYTITSALLEQELGIELNDILPGDNTIDVDKMGEIFLKQLTRDFYGIIAMWSANINKTLYLLSKNDYRASLKEGLLRLADYRLTYNTQEIPQEVKDFMASSSLLFRGTIEIQNEDLENYEAKGVEW